MVYDWCRYSNRPCTGDIGDEPVILSAEWVRADSLPNSIGRAFASSSDDSRYGGEWLLSTEIETTWPLTDIYVEIEGSILRYQHLDPESAIIGCQTLADEVGPLVSGGGTPQCTPSCFSRCARLVGDRTCPETPGLVPQLRNVCAAACSVMPPDFWVQPMVEEVFAQVVTDYLGGLLDASGCSGSVQASAPPCVSPVTGPAYRNRPICARRTGYIPFNPPLDAFVVALPSSGSYRKRGILLPPAVEYFRGHWDNTPRRGCIGTRVFPANLDSS